MMHKFLVSYRFEAAAFLGSFELRQCVLSSAFLVSAVAFCVQSELLAGCSGLSEVAAIKIYEKPSFDGQDCQCRWGSGIMKGVSSSMFPLEGKCDRQFRSGGA